MKKFKVIVMDGGGKDSGYFKHEHIVRAANKKVLERKLKDMEIINGREYVRIEEVGKQL